MSFNKYWTICTWSCKNLSFLGAGFLLFLPGMIWGAGDTVLSAKPEEQFLININTGAENVTRITEKKYAAKEAGDNAFAAGDFGVAASFYRKYREDAVQDKNESAKRIAFECEIDALIFAGLAEQAENVLKEFKLVYSNVNSTSLAIWEADILLNRRQLDKAGQLLGNILPKLNSGDPRRVRVLSSLAFIFELKQQFKEAASLYQEIAGQQSDQRIGRKTVERRILNLIAAGEQQNALELLKNIGLAENTRDLTAVKLLNFYMQLSDSVYSEALKKEWQDLKNVTPNTLVKINDPFFCLIYARIAVCLENQKKYAESFEAYRLAYAFSALKTDSMLMLESMLACLGKMDRKTDAAMLALKEYELFYSNAITEPVRFKFADILIHGNMSKEAVNILAKDLNDPNVSAGKKQRIFWKSLDMLLNRKLYFDANSFVKIVYPDKKSYENMEALKKIQIASGNFKNALEFCRKIAVSYPEFQLKNYREAVDLAYSLKDYTNLISFADLILKENPEDSVLFLRAVAYEELGKVEQAEHDYLAFINYAKRDDTSDSLAQAYYRVGRLMMMSGQDTVEAIPYFLLLFERFPDHSLAPATGYWLTHLYLEADDTGRVYAVIDNMKKRYAKNRFTGSAIFKQALYEHDMGDIKSSQKLLAELKGDAYPDIQAQALYENARIYYEEKEWQKAHDSLDTLIKKYPDASCTADVYYLQGDIYREENLFKEAIASYEKVLPFSLQNSSLLKQSVYGAVGDCYFALASSTDRSEFLNNAVGSYEKLLSFDDVTRENIAMAHYRLARCHQLLKQQEKALENLKVLLYFLPPDEIERHPLSTYWIVKGVNLAEQLALQNPLPESVKVALQALDWLERSGIQNAETIYKRVRKIRKQQQITMRNMGE